MPKQLIPRSWRRERDFTIRLVLAAGPECAGVGFMLDQCSMILVVAASLLACGDSGTGGSGAGGAAPGGSNAGASNPGGSNPGGANAGGDGSGGGTPCDAPIAEIVAKIEKCPTMPVGGGNFGGGDLGGGNEGGGKPFDCTADNLALVECLSACYQAATCDAIDGTDPKAQADFYDCLAVCSA